MNSPPVTIHESRETTESRMVIQLLTNNLRKEILFYVKQKIVSNHFIESYAVAEDITQVIMKHLFEKRHKYVIKEGKRTIDWIRSVIHTKYIDEIRQKTRERNKRASKDTSDLKLRRERSYQYITTHPSNQEILQELLSILRQLPDEQYIIVEKRLKKEGFKDIAEELSISQNTASGRLAYAKRNLRKTKRVQELWEAFQENCAAQEVGREQ